VASFCERELSYTDTKVGRFLASRLTIQFSKNILSQEVSKLECDFAGHSVSGQSIS
jgi:hypothetical protein